MKKLIAVGTLIVTVSFINAPRVTAADAVTTSHGIAMHGDLKYPAGFKHFDYVNPDAPRGGSVRLGARGGFDSLNPFIVSGTAAAGSGQIYDSLMTNAADEAFSHYGLLAETITVPEDRSWAEFSIRPEAKWHDNVPVSVEDVIWTFNTLLEKGRPLYRLYYGSINHVEKTGDRSVRFTFAPGENRELPLIIGEMPVLPRHYWESREFDKTTLEPPLGSGPYRISRVDAGRSISLERVGEYWGADVPVNAGRYNFDSIRYDYYRDAGVLLEAFKAGEFDYRSENSSKAWATEYDIPAVHNGHLIQDTIKHNASGMQGFIFNTRRDVFRDSRVREALAYAFDFEWSNASLFYGQYTRTRSYFDNSELAARGLPDDDELALLEPFRGQVPDRVFEVEYNPPTTDGSGNIRNNLRQAGKLLNEAGWTVSDGKRIHVETGQAFAFEILLGNPLFERVVLPFKQNLAKLGIDVSIRTVDSAQYVQRLDTFDFDMVVSGMGQSRSPGNEQRAFWGSAAATMEGGRNLMGIQDPVIDSLIETLIAAPDRKSLVTATRALDRVLQWGHWVIPHWHISYDRIAYWNMFGRPEITPVTGNRFMTWWVDSAKLEALNRYRSSSGG